MWRSYDYEFKQQNHAFHEKRSSWGPAYPSDEDYYVPPPTMQNMVNNHPPFHYEPFDDNDDDDDDHHHHEHVAAVNNNRGSMVHHDHGNRSNLYGAHHVSNHHDGDVRTKHQHGRILRPPSHQYGYPVGVEQRGKEAYSRINNNNPNPAIDDYYSRKYFPQYGGVSRLKDDYGNNEGIIGEVLDYNSLMKGMHGGNKVKKIEVIEYERRTYRGARQDWIVLGGSGSTYPNKYAPN